MPFLPLKASVRTLNASSPALDLAFASTRSFRDALRFVRYPLLFLGLRISSARSSVFLMRWCVSSAPSSFLRPGSCLDSNVLEAATPTRLDVHLLLLPDTDLGAYSRGSHPLFPVRYELHAFHDGDTTQLPRAKLPRRKIREGFSAMSLSITVGSAVLER